MTVSSICFFFKFRSMTHGPPVESNAEDESYGNSPASGEEEESEPESEPEPELEPKHAKKRTPAKASGFSVTCAISH